MYAIEHAVQTFITIFVRLPLWVISAIPRQNRPLPGWSLKRTVLLQFIKYTFSSRTLDDPDHTAIVEGPGVKGVWVTPVPHLVHGEVKDWANMAGVECVRIPGYWMDKQGLDIPVEAAPEDGEKVLYHLHGGAYAVFSAHPSDPIVSGPQAILDHSPSIRRLFNLEYRRSTGPADAPKNPFPAALLDAIAGYDYLVNQVGFTPENIVISGESAGGNLALALIRYLVEQRAQGDSSIPPPPGALILVSPWVDLGVRGHEPSSSLYTNLVSDYLNPHSVHWIFVIRQFLGPLGWHAADTNRYISPASELLSANQISFEGFPRTMIIGGGAEVFRDQIRILHERMAKDLGDKDVEYHEFPDAVHAFVIIPPCEPERTHALQLVRDWLDPARS